MTAREDLQRQLDAVYAAIQELDEDLAAGRMSEADHAELRRRSERQAAALLKRVRQAEQEAHQPPLLGTGPGPSVGARLRSPLVLTLGAVVLVVLGVAVGLLLGRSTSDERAGVGPGAVAMSAAPSGAAVSAELETLRKEVEGESAPTKKLLAFAHLALDEGQVPAAIWAYKRVLAREPKNAEAITHMAIILYQGGHVDQAVARIDEALRIDPKYAHAHWDRAHMLFTGKTDYPAAARALETFLALVPTGEDADRARAMLAEARRQAGPREGRDRGTTPTAPAGRGPGSSALPTRQVVPAAARQPLSPVLFRGKAAEAYQVTHEIGDTLAELPCYCGCDKTAGHANLLACFLDRHGST